MNERIKELAKQACITIVPEPFDDASRAWNDTMEKFVELIIDECCSKLLDMDQKVNGNHNYYKHAAIEIKRSFK
jgi:hypothetical protein